MNFDDEIGINESPDQFIDRQIIDRGYLPKHVLLVTRYRLYSGLRLFLLVVVQAAQVGRTYVIAFHTDGLTIWKVSRVGFKLIGPELESPPIDLRPRKRWTGEFSMRIARRTYWFSEEDAEELAAYLSASPGKGAAFG